MRWPQPKGLWPRDLREKRSREEIHFETDVEAVFPRHGGSWLKAHRSRVSRAAVDSRNPDATGSWIFQRGVHDAEMTRKAEEQHYHRLDEIVGSQTPNRLSGLLETGNVVKEAG